MNSLVYRFSVSYVFLSNKAAILLFVTIMPQVSDLIPLVSLPLSTQAYVQTSAVVSDAGETVAIICEDEKMAYLYSLPEYGTGEGLDQDMEGPAALSES